jgi:hypothetical protein
MNENTEVWNLWQMENLNHMTQFETSSVSYLQSETLEASDNWRYELYLQWLPEEVLIDVLEINDVCRLGDVIYQGTWSKPNPLKDLWYFELKKPVESGASFILFESIKYWDFVSDRKVIRGWLSSVQGEYSPTPDPFSVEWEESVYSDEKFWHLV